MTLRTKGIWRALKAERSPEEGEVFIGEEEVIKENFSLTTDAPEKGKGTPMLARATASTNTSTTNTNAVSTDEVGANYSHIANSFIVGPQNAQKFVSAGSRYTTRIEGERASHVSKRSRGRGK
jgi:hypothetical protein